MERRTIAILFGGVSTEHEVSLQSAAAVIESIPAAKYHVIKIGITKNGRWYKFDGISQQIKDKSWEKSPFLRRVVISPDHQKPGLIVLDEAEHTYLHIDCYFPVLHGKNGEDGTIQGLFDISNVPYVGCGTLSSALCMDKVFAQQIVKSVGLRTTEFIFFHQHQYCSLDVEAWAKEKVGYPIFVKPANSGSSYGITKASNDLELRAAIERAFIFDEKVLCEGAIKGMEVGCAVYGNESPETGLIGEIEPSKEFLDFDDKYLLGEIKQYVPARQEQHVLNKVQELGIQIYQLLGCKGLARVDFFVQGDGAIIFNEINTMPGFTTSSRYPKMIEASGISYSELLDELIELAIRRGEAS
ncbi:D-alanine--D-alanine ligase family protein [Alkalicoccobacillus plakortidis]|uniref:D-alanine--D-alanine ligase n=1 Tax=Alkalicoccobacillus plakortidis TaxID=444060 RepID=A0ABT0XRI5_9BACI|nr:D-alanine--D-alanine ligase family protein [Alkalicoccobacillus plakortidis]MCM2677907.1 D-alanine--D-alanine ligase [Alkalicoccobacillus plakortidis]